MSLYAAYVLTDTSGSVHRVFLIRKPSSDQPAFDVEKLRDLREWMLAKYSQDLKSVDLEVTELDQLKDKIKQLNGSTLRRRKR